MLEDAAELAAEANGHSFVVCASSESEDGEEAVGIEVAHTAAAAAVEETVRIAAVEEREEGV